MDDAAKSLAQFLSGGRCPECGNYYGRILFEFEGEPDEEMCETCWELRAATSEPPPVSCIEFRDNTRQAEERW